MKKAFTLIEVIVVLVIIAIIATIAVPIIYNIKEKSREKSYRLSIDRYGHAIEIALASYELEHGDYPNSIDELNIEYTGSKVECNIKKIRSNGEIYLSECYVDDNKIEDKNNEDGYYHYGILEYGDYKIGDVITYNNLNYYVLKNSSKDDRVLTLLKAEPLTVEETNRYGGKWNYTTSTSWSIAGYGGIIYYGSNQCYSDPANGRGPSSGCQNNYDSSHVKQIVDLWAEDSFNMDDLVKDLTGYSARLITYEEYSNFLNVEEVITYTITNDPISNTKYVDYDWLYGNNYWYWTMNPYRDSTDFVWHISKNGNIENSSVKNIGVVRPVITIKKDVIE